MHYHPYSPQWHNKTTVDPLTAWSQYRDSLVLWAEISWFEFIRDERRSVWYITYYTGTAALVLLLLMFQDSMKTVVPSTVVAVNEGAVEVPEYEFLTESQSDPFKTYGSPEQPQPTVPAPMGISEAQPELTTSIFSVSLPFDGEYSESPVLVTAQSQFVALRPNTLFLASGWKSSDPFNSIGTTVAETVATVAVASWFDRSSSLNVTPVVVSKLKTVALGAQQASGDVVLTKHLPAIFEANQPATYELVVHNRSSTIQRDIVVEELVFDHKTVVDVFPAAQVAGHALRWKIDSIAPDEKRRFQVTCVVGDRSAVLKTESGLRLISAVSSKTNVVVPDVEISLTLPVSVEKSEEFPVQIEISNNSDQSFAATNLNIRFLKGIQVQQKNSLVHKTEVPLPGKSIRIQLLFTAMEAGTGVIEVELDLDQSLMVPVKAYTQIRSKDGQQNERQAVIKKTSFKLTEIDAR